MESPTLSREKYSSSIYLKSQNVGLENPNWVINCETYNTSNKTWHIRKGIDITFHKKIKDLYFIKNAIK